MDFSGWDGQGSVSAPAANERTLHQESDPVVLTDIYGRQITNDLTQDLIKSLHSAENEVEGKVEAEADVEREINYVRRLQGSLQLPKQIVDEIIVKEKEEQVILTYAETLHRGLKIMWVPMVYLGRMPFRLILKKNRASIVVNKRSVVYVSCFTMCVLTWILFVWINVGILSLVGRSTLVGNEGVKKVFSEYWSDYFIFYTTLLQACISTTHILYQADDFALFIKAWYRVLDITKIEVSKTLKQYIITSQIVLVVFILFMVIIYSVPPLFLFLRGTTVLIVLTICEPVNRILDLVHVQYYKKHEESDTLMAPYEKFAIFGLIVYLIAVVFSWMYIMQFMVFCRCFRKGLNCINERIAMILNVDDVQRVGPNALRLTYEYIHKDYLGIATTGIKIGKIFSWTMCTYYMCSILVIVVELGEIFKFAKVDYRKGRIDDYLIGMKPEDIKLPLAIQHFLNEFIHFVITVFCICYVSYEGSGAHEEGKMSYELARYKGLVDCTTQLERNFIRSIWIIVSEKCPVHVAPGKFFGISNSMILTVFATGFTYFIFWAQSRNV